jgi:hypothetical protein
LSPIPYLVAIVILGVRAYEAYQQSHHLTFAHQLPSAVVVLVIATLVSLLIGRLNSRRESRRRSSRYSRGSSYPY